MTEQEWIEFLINGIPQCVSITRIPPELSQVLHSSTQLVQMHHAYAVKAHAKHGIDPHRLPMIRLTIELGRAVLDRRGHLQFFYFEEVVFSKWFHVVIKPNLSGNELWVSSAHITKPGEVARLTKAGRIIRPEKR